MTFTNTPQEGMSIWSWFVRDDALAVGAHKKAEEIRRQRQEKSSDVDNLEATAPSPLWREDSSDMPRRR